jgi:hypothetical protein
MSERKRKIRLTGEVLHGLELSDRRRKPTTVADLVDQLDA